MICTFTQNPRVLKSWESQSLGSPGVFGVLESQTMNCTFAIVIIVIIVNNVTAMLPKDMQKNADNCMRNEEK